jgi:arylsulfatase A-like enzyme
MQHGRQGHNATVFEEMVRVPLVLWAPDRFVPGVVEAPVSLLDLMPSLIEWADLAPPDHALRGTSLSATLRGHAPFERTLFLSSRYKDDPSKLHLGVRRGSDKLVRWAGAEGSMLFELAGDPGESLDVKEQHPELARELERALLEWHASRVGASEPDEVRPDRGLEALGTTQK